MLVRSLRHAGISVHAADRREVAGCAGLVSPGTRAEEDRSRDTPRPTREVGEGALHGCQDTFRSGIGSPNWRSGSLSNEGYGFMRPQKPATRGQFNVSVNGRFWMSTEGIATGKKPVLALRGLRPRCVDGSAIGPTIARRCLIPRRRKVTSVPHQSVKQSARSRYIKRTASCARWQPRRQT